jgi:hypothetical protein
MFSQTKHACMTIPLGKEHLALVTMTQTLDTDGYSQIQLLKNM